MSAPITADDGVTPATGPRQLTVAELQQAMRSLQGRRAVEPGGDVAGTAGQQWGDTARPKHDARGDSAPADVVVLAAHAGAGASTVALAIADAAAAAERSVHLIDAAPPGRSGLVAAPVAELGLDRTGSWRRGVRSAITLDRRADGGRGGDWPSLDGPGAAFMVVDIGSDGDPGWTRATCPVVVVCRSTVPGVRRAEAVLADLGERDAVLAVVGSHRWAPVVRTSLGPHLRSLSDAALVVTFPIDRSLQISGVTDQPLPWAVRSAGARLLGLLDSPYPASARSSATVSSGNAR